ncbi:MAG: hypothetical protein A2015_16170 [Spirochaetes bacterium GWF1_31_7]|nr:MAG: hypothetical protein A2Y30_13540 [Spirochaetes bacterium GWE1_32_154]OHD49987.1 MAG: hypothetical protein A2Y29_11585 [Spirochaetes bacterium GWE2_31_10]OHD52303.1 MAG: hypothetical protein A2015_16170 [Spirochaetes bacterium GWF1_31_7]OHD80997.1 MAG: hypothetical protein A2355_08605 [Spirochaetes bacterium RIFOXYB1_FULL_32_8]HBD95284.1 hypothetical protein [Spirochaetia bacterium]
MAGLNGQGPQNGGAGTGRKMGLCYSPKTFGRGGMGKGICGRWASGETLSSSAENQNQKDNTPDFLKSQRDFFAARLKEVEDRLAGV